MPHLTSVTLSNSVANIGTLRSGCASLTRVTLPTASQYRPVRLVLLRLDQHDDPASVTSIGTLRLIVAPA